jgi:NTE family protein
MFEYQTVIFTTIMKSPNKISLFLFIFIALLSAQNKTILKLDYQDKHLPFGLTEKIPKALPKVGLALSGGGSRSISQIGVLRAMEERKIPIEYIVGTSMGSIIGGLYSSGYKIDDLDSLLQKTKWDDFFSAQQSNRNELFIDQKVSEDRALVSLRLDGFKLVIPTSFSSGQRAANSLNLMAINAPIIAEDSYDLLKYKFRAISSDLVSGKEYIIRKGPLGAALRASSSVTLLLPPVKKDSLMLVDGGLVANVPVKETQDLGADIVVAVNSSSPLYTEPELDVPWRIADQLVSIPMRILNDQQISEADFLIEPNLDGRKNSDFENLKDVIKRGYDYSIDVVNKLKNRIETVFKLNIPGEEKIFSNLILNENPSLLEKELISNVSNLKNVSSKDLQYHLYQVTKDGYWHNLAIEVVEQDGYSILFVRAVENPILSEINLLSPSVIGADSVFNILNPLLNKPFSGPKTFEGILKVLGLYKRNGYSFANIEKVEFDSTTNTLNLSIDEGIISKVTVDGNHKTKERIITREFPLKVGDYFKYDIAEKGLTNLRSTNLFDQIELTVIKHNGINELIISLQEKESAIIRLGMRIDNEYLTQVSVDARDENFNGTGTEIGAVFSGGVRNQTYSIEQKANRVFDSYLTYKVRGFYESTDIYDYVDDPMADLDKFSRSRSGEYRQKMYGGTFGIGAQVERFGNLFLEARYQRDEISGLYDYTGESYKTDISSVRLSLLIDSQNEYPYPTKGFLIKSFYETAQKTLGGDVGYTKFLFDYKAYFGLRVDHVWCFRTMIGSADKTLPLSQQFSFGGQNTFFGLRENEYRGRQIFLTSLEVRYKLPVKLFFDTFIRLRYDLGSIWTNREEIRFKDLRHGVGLTLSFNTPIGPADFAVGKSFYFANSLPKNTIVWGSTFFYFTIGYYY